MHTRNPQSVPGHADEPDEPLVPGTGQGLDRATRSVGGLPLVWLDEIVQLDEVDGVDAEAGQREFEAGARPVARAIFGLGCEEEPIPVRRHPWRDPKFGVAVGGRRVDVVDAEFEQHRKDLVGALLPH